MTHPELWRRMDSAPRDGTSFDVLCVSRPVGHRVVVPKLHYGPKPMSAKDHSDLILWGSQNFLSPYLKPIGWRPLK